jgi:protein-L-isoaspartate O-methyltransferase
MILKGVQSMGVRSLALGAALLAVGAQAPVQAQTQAPAAPAQAPLRSPDVIFVPTPPEVVEAMLKLAEVKAGDVVYDLGCGDGIIVATAAQKYGATAVGIDIDPQRVKEATDRIQKAQVTDKVKILNQDLFTTDISKATVVTLYLLPSLNQKLIPKLNKELPAGTRVVSQSFNMGDQNPPLQTLDVNGRQVYLWKTPLKEAQ